MMLEWSSDSLEVPFHPFSRDSVWLVQIFLLPWRGSCDTVLCCNVSQIFLNIRITWCLLKNDFWASHTCCSQSPCRGLGTCVFFIFPSWVLLGDLGNTVLTGYTWERPQSKVWHLSLFFFFSNFSSFLTETWNGDGAQGIFRWLEKGSLLAECEGCLLAIHGRFWFLSSVGNLVKQSIRANTCTHNRRRATFDFFFGRL